MDLVPGAHKGLLCPIIVLCSCALIASGTFLPKRHNPGRKLWMGDASQDPEFEGNTDPQAVVLPWGIHIPSTITLRDWSLKWVPLPVAEPQDDNSSGGKQNRKSYPWGSAREDTPFPRSQKVAVYPAAWVPGWGGKRSLVVADDALFREKSKMLTAIERQKWLNSYMQKFLVVNSD